MPDGLKRFPDVPPPALELRLVVAVLAPAIGVIVAVAALAIASLSVLAGVRAYAGGESQWSKARSEAVEYLRDYARRGDAADYRRFENALRVPQGDRLAREEMDRPHPDRERARAGLLAGDNDPADVDGMISLYLHFSRLSLFQAPREAWSDGDRLLEHLRDEAWRLREERNAHLLDPPSVDAYLGRIGTTNGQLIDAERRFSAGLSQSARLVEGSLVAGLLVITVALSVASIWLARRSLQRRAIRERVQAAASERWSLAAEAGGLGLYDWTVGSDQLRLDAKASAVYGLDPLPLEGEGRLTPRATLAALVHPDDLPIARRELEAAIAAGRRYKARYRVRHRDGSWRMLETFGLMQSPDKADRRAGARMVGVVRDVTEEARQSELAMERDTAERAARARMEFLSRLSHELRTPLNAILGFAQLLMLEGQHPLTAGQAERVRLILDSGRQLLKLVEDVLDLTRIDAGAVSMTLEAVDVTQALRASVAMVGAAVQAYNVRMVNQAPAEPLWATADARRLQQVLLNLLTNACKYNRPGGEVSVNAWRVGDRVCLCVSDTGVGITDAERLELFQPFKRLASTAGQVEGTGLGLFIVRSLLERMHGQIALESVWGQGSTFTVSLPASAGPAAELKA